ncbi:putative nuclease HARBI1 [Hypomesus transpacificus]|uniref:putative nuclease HARBI1 n=1 Tax=Hypomesus transpacificus TaxID=137520 RepID=UPI001F086341|nr:putative nuclease HARBI1 [Hypomesus transpacificus]XP_046874256.1 putative nuclease HARBI1 [Hypomesus transpacificus]
MAELAFFEDVARQRIRRERIFREHTDLLANGDEWLISRFRLSRAVLLELCAVLGPALARNTRRNNAVPVPLQVLTTLGFLATGTFQRELADRSGISQPTLSRVMPDVLGGIVSLTHLYIKFPYTVAEQANKKAQFAAMSGFPNVIGAIDCTHVAIRAPSMNENAFVNRKHFHSINVQVICDADMLLVNVVARWPGSTHDSFILRQSSVGRRLEAGAVRDGWILGDSGYPLKQWLLTPFANPQSAEERQYNISHTQTRSVVERTIGLFKGRWRCLDRTGGMLLYRPEKVCQMIRACAVLHNMAQLQNVPLPPGAEAACVRPDPDPQPQAFQPNGAAVRQRLAVMRRL